MSRLRSPFVTACQQLLALAAVLAVLTPAARVVSLDVVRQPPAGAAASDGQGALSAYARVARKAATLPSGPVEAHVREVPLVAGATGAGSAGSTATARRLPGGALSVVSAPEVVTGYGAVGVTWAHGTAVAEDDLSVEARTLDGGTWSGWTQVEYDAEHGPDPDSAEGRHARPGTEPLLVGDVDRVQVRVTDRTGSAPADLRLAVIDPGTPTTTVSERAALDTTTMDTTTDATTGTAPAARSTVTPEPQIFSRAQWGADESMRDASSLHYFEVHAGFVHHTVNANDYTREEVPGILRSIYAYHTRSRGWSDVGYNFLVDRFGRIWEGRYGGVDRPVVGAHTLGYNDYAFAMSAIGNFETAQPSEAMVQAYGALFAWKLSLHGVDAASTRQVVGPDTFQAINGHRDAGQTACPGKNLYARLGDIRQLAAAAQVGWEGRDLDSDLVGSPYPDLVARRASDGRLVILPTGGLTRVEKPAVLSTGWGGYAATLVSPDLSGDGRPDVLGRTADGSVEVRVDGTVLRTATATRGHDLLAAAGDVDGDGLNDLVGRETATGRPTLFRGRGNGGFTATPMVGSWSGYDLLAGVGDLDADGTPDLVARDAAGTLWLLPAGGAGVPSVLVQGGPRYDAVTGMADWNDDGRTDLLVRREGGQAFVLPGNGDGTVGAPRGPVKRLKGRADLAGVGDLTGTTAPDLVVRRGDEVLVLAGAGTYETGGTVETDVRAGAADLVLNAGDWDGDGFGDLLLRMARNGAVKLRAGDGMGGFAKAVTIGTGLGGVRLLEAVGDMTGDGWPDLMGQPAGGSMRIYPGRGAAPLGPSYVAHTALSGTRQVGVGRWDGDGAPDTLVRRGDDLLLYSGNGPGGLTGARDTGLDLAGFDLVTGIADITLRERPDLVLREQATGRLLLVESTADGFKAPRVIADGAEAYDLVD